MFVKLIYVSLNIVIGHIIYVRQKKLQRLIDSSFILTERIGLGPCPSVLFDTLNNSRTDLPREWMLYSKKAMNLYVSLNVVIGHIVDVRQKKNCNGYVIHLSY